MLEFVYHATNIEVVEEAVDSDTVSGVFNPDCSVPLAPKDSLGAFFVGVNGCGSPVTSSLSLSRSAADDGDVDSFAPPPLSHCCSSSRMGSRIK